MTFLFSSSLHEARMSLETSVFSPSEKKNFFHDAQISLLSRYYTKILFSRISIYDTLLKRNQDLKTLEGDFQFPQDIVIIKYNIVCFKKIVVGIDVCVCE